MRNDLFSPAIRLLSLAVHGTFFVLLAIAVVRSAADGLPGAATGGVLLGVLYLCGLYLVAGPRERRPRRRRRDQGEDPDDRPVHRGRRGHQRAGMRIWLAPLTLGWAGLAVMSPSFVWIAFPMFFLYLYLLPLRAGVPGVVLLTGAAIGAVAWHGDGIAPAEVLGPSIGAAVATIMTLAYKALYEESLHRQRLIDELVATRGRLVRAETDAARLTERERLAREIHDTLAQGMSSIILLLRAARRDLDAAREADRVTGGVRDAHAARGRLDAVRGRLEEAERAAAENLEEARSFVRGLASPVLRHSSLADALRRIAESAEARSATRVRFDAWGDPAELPVEHETALVRIAQGALGNAVQHSDAERVAVTLTYLDDMVVLDVVDDGRGFDPAADGAASGGGTGYGLRAMHDRAAALGGTLNVESAPGEGTAVAASLPLPDVDREE